MILPPNTANIKIDNISFTDENADYIDNSSEGETNAIWGDYVIINRYEKEYNRYMLSVTAPEGFNGDDVSFVQLGKPTLLWISDFTASRTGEMPFIPDPIIADPSWVLLDEHLEPEMLVAIADGNTPVYRISGTYIYGHRRPAQSLVQNVNYCRPPWLEDVFARTVTQNALKPNLNTVNSYTIGTGGGYSIGTSPGPVTNGQG